MNWKPRKPLYPHRTAETITPQEAEAALDYLVSIGRAWQGVDGRYYHIEEGKENPQ